jgi:DNA adenine methylase
MRKMSTPLKIIGGKNRLKRKLVTLFPAHDIYGEPFLGAGHLLFFKGRSKQEWVSDVDDLIINLWRVLKHAEMHKMFVDWLTNHPKARKLFYDYREMLEDPAKYKTIPQVIRAAMAYFVMKSSFGAMRLFTGQEVWDSSIGTDKMGAFYNTDWDAVYWRLKDVVIENRDFRHFIPMLSKKASTKKGKRTFIYNDPPYFSTVYHPMPCFRHNFTMEDHEDLAKLLTEFKGKWLLSIDDCEDSRRLYKDFNIQEVETYHISEVVNKKPEELKVTELVVANYKFPKKGIQEIMFEGYK